MSRISSILVLAGLLVLAAVGAAVGQAGVLAGLVQPFVVNIEQQVPVEVTLALPMDDGTVITATAPITVGVSLQVKIDGAQVVAVTSGEAEPAAATVEAAPAVVAASPESQAVLSQTVAGVTIEVLGLEFVPIGKYEERDPKTASSLTLYSDSPPAAAGILTLRITNHTDESARVIPVQSAVVVIAGEQIDLSGYYQLITNDIDTTYFPNASKQGGVTFSISQSAFDAVSTGAPVAYYIGTDGRDYTFEIQPTLTE